VCSCQIMVHMQIAKVCRVKMRIKSSMMLERNSHLFNKSVDITQKTNQLRILSRSGAEAIWNIYKIQMIILALTLTILPSLSIVWLWFIRIKKYRILGLRENKYST